MQKLRTTGEKIVPNQQQQQPKRKIGSAEKQSCPKCGSSAEARKIWVSPAGIEVIMCTVCRFYTKKRGEKSNHI